jgi:hypothetical protein
LGRPGRHRRRGGCRRRVDPRRREERPKCYYISAHTAAYKKVAVMGDYSRPPFGGLLF